MMVSTRLFLPRAHSGSFGLMTAILLALIAVIGVVRGMDRNFPAIYRHTASLGIAISESRYGTSGFVGLADVADALGKGGFAIQPQEARVRYLSDHPEIADKILKQATELQHVDRSRTFVLEANETGMIDWYLLSFKLFGYHIRGFYWLFVICVAAIAGSFLLSFRHTPIFIAPSLLYLSMLATVPYELNLSDLQIATPASARFLPLVCLYPVIFALTLSASARRFRAIHVLTAAMAGLVFAFCANTRSYAFWQLGAPVTLIAWIWLARRRFGRWLPWCNTVSRYAIAPLVVFGIVAGAGVGIHHLRKDQAAYAQNIFFGHEYWLAYVYATRPEFLWRIPELEKRSGMTIDNADAYAGAMVRIELQDEGGRLEDYLIGDGFWNNAKREELARRVVFKLWQQYPLAMLHYYYRVLNPASIEGMKVFANLLATAFILTAASSAGGPWLFVWLAALGWWLGPLVLITNLFALWLNKSLDASDRRYCGKLIPAAALLAIMIIPSLLILPHIGTETVDYGVAQWLLGVVLFVTLYQAARTVLTPDVATRPNVENGAAFHTDRAAALMK
jgi:hypothetical protein